MKGDPSEVLPGALEQLRPALANVLRRYHIPPIDAEDLVQEALAVTLDKWPEVEQLDRWIPAVLANRCISYWRARRRRDFVFQPIPPGWDAGYPGHDAAVEARVEVRRLLPRIPPGQRRLAFLRFWLGYSAGAAGRAAGYHPSSGRKMVGRALAALRKLLNAGKGYS